MRIKVEISTDMDTIEITRFYDDIRAMQEPPVTTTGPLATARLQSIVNQLVRMGTKEGS